jgi:hypothetical protein
MSRYLFNLLIAFDQLLNVLICNGEPDETMSSAAYRMERDGRFWGFMRPVIDFLFSWHESDHCFKAYESELLRRQYSPEFQKAKE